MDGEFVSIIGSIAAVGIGLAGLVVRTTARPDRRIDRLEESLNRRIDGVEESFGHRIDGVEKGQAELRERMARLEGLREAISGRRAA